MAKIREVKVERDEHGDVKLLQVVFGPHYFVELLADAGRVSLCLGATHHGFRADASDVNGELEKFIDEIRDRHPENVTD